VNFDAPNLLYHLHCKFNRQLSLDYNVGPWKDDKFWMYHKCPLTQLNTDVHFDVFDDTNTLIIHSNGNDTSFNGYIAVTTK
jgi:hypothetical protein